MSGPWKSCILLSLIDFMKSVSSSTKPFYKRTQQKYITFLCSISINTSTYFNSFNEVRYHTIVFYLLTVPEVSTYIVLWLWHKLFYSDGSSFITNHSDVPSPCCHKLIAAHLLSISCHSCFPHRYTQLTDITRKHTLTIINHLYILAQTGYTMYNVFTTQIIFNWSFGVNIQHLSYALYETHLVVILAQVQNDSYRRCSLFIAALVLVQTLVTDEQHQSNGLGRMFLVRFFLDLRIPSRAGMSIFCILYRCFVVASICSSTEAIDSSRFSFLGQDICLPAHGCTSLKKIYHDGNFLSILKQIFQFNRTLFEDICSQFILALN